MDRRRMMAMVLAGGGAIPNTLLTDSLVGAWDFHETSGHYASLDGTGPTLNDDGAVKRIGGVFGRAVNGAYYPTTANDCFVTAGTNSVFNAGIAKSFTFALLTSPQNQTAGGNYILSKAYGGGNPEYVLISDATSFYWRIYNGTAAVSAVVGSYPEAPQALYGELKLVVITFDAVTKLAGISVDGMTIKTVDTSAFSVATVLNSKFNLLSIFDINYSTNIPIHFCARWDRVLTQAEITKLYNSGKFLNYPFTTPVVDNSYKLVFDGDSHTARRCYPLDVLAKCGRGHPYANFAVGGQTTATILAREATTLASFDATCTKNILFIMSGTNDISMDRTAAQIFADLSTYCAAAKAAGFKVIISTVYKNGVFTAPRIAVRNTLNALILGMGAELVDGIFDPGGDAALQTTNDGVYFVQDTVHLSSTGDAYVATLAKTVLDTVLAA